MTQRHTHDDVVAHIGAGELFELVSFREAAAAIRAAAAQFDGYVWNRSVLDLPSGQFFLMPAQSPAGVGAKLVTLAPDSPNRDLPRIHAAYVLFDAETLRLSAVIDGTALTTLRTPAVSAAAVDAVATDTPHRVVIFGSGPQAWGHAKALESIRAIEDLVLVGRSPSGAAELAASLRKDGTPARVGAPGDVAHADLVVCATTARQPLFDGRLLRDGAVCVAVGSHEADARELDDATMGRANTVIVEDVDTALREAGDIIQAVDRGVVPIGSLTTLSEAVRNAAPEGITVFKSVGMGWEDLAVAEVAARRYREVREQGSVHA